MRLQIRPYLDQGIITLLMLLCIGFSKAQHSYSTSPSPYFEENKGQLADEVLFQGRIGDTEIRFLEDGVSYARTRPIINGEDTLVECAVWNMDFISPSRFNVHAARKHTTQVNYLKADANGDMIGSVARYAEILYTEIYPHIDLRYYFEKDGQLKYDLILKPGFDLDKVAFNYQGVEQIGVDSSGNLNVSTPFGGYIDKAPFSFQNEVRGQTVIDISYKLLGDRRFGFSLNGDYDRSKPIILDPGALIWGTYVQSSTSGEFYENIDIDSSGNVILGGGSLSTNYPTTPGVYQLSNAGSRDATVTKISADGTTVLWATYFGGSASDNISDIFLMPTGEIIFAGTTNSTDLPVTASAFQSSINGTQDAYLAKISGDGTALLASTYFGGSQSELGFGTNFNSSGELMLVGTTYASTDVPVTAGAIQSSNPGGSRTGFFCKFNTDLTNLNYGTYFGGSNAEFITNIRLDAAENIYLSGSTGSDNIPITTGAFQTTRAGFDDVIVCKLDPTATSIMYSTYVGSSHYESCHALDVSPSGEVVFSGNTHSASGFPTTPNAFQSSTAGSGDGMVGRLSADGSSLLYGSYIGGSQTLDEAYSIYLDESDYIHLLGRTQSVDFITTPDAFDLSHNGNFDLYYSVVHPNGSLHYSTFIGGSDEDRNNLRGVSVHPFEEHVYIAGYTRSSDMPTTSGAFQETYFATDFALWLGKFDNPAPYVSPVEICDNGLDDDGDGLTDCYDPDCNGSGLCPDNDSDGFTDAIDLDDDNDGILDMDERCSDINTTTIYAAQVIYNSGDPQVTPQYGDPTQALGAPDWDGDVTDNPEQFVSVGLNGANLILAWAADLYATNSGDASDDVGILEVGIVESSFVSLRPTAATKVLLDDQGLLTSDANGFYQIGMAGGATVSFDIDAVTANAFDAGELLFDQMKITTNETVSFTTPGTAGPDIDAVEVYFSISCPDRDTDGDSKPDYLDLDSDNDGIYDSVESGSGEAQTAGVLDGGVDTVGIPLSVSDGLSGVDYTYADTDSDSTFNPYDRDSDGDGCDDVIEAGFPDSDGDGQLGGLVPPTVDQDGKVTSGGL
ncbi:MAG: hypothetical protein HKO93_08230 [Flavobacteriales bacterium]|nr:hypothetical protein [Flavobacteriales bacterium]